MNSTSSNYTLLIALIVSLLFHLLVLRLHTPTPATKPATKPLYVEVLPQQPQRETVVPQQPRQRPAKAIRQGAVDQRVNKEQAPKGSDLEDSSAVVSRPKVLRHNKQQRVHRKEKQQQKRVVKALDTSATLAQSPVSKPQSQPLPTLEQLLHSSNTAAANIARSTRTKQRPNIENGDKLLLNMRKDKLFSFFSRFKRGVYDAWNYPKEAIDNHQQGLALLKIVINRDGSVEDVDLVQGSGFERLDREAIAAIFKGQPYGALPLDYPDEQLTINACFEYILGQSKPRIYRRQ